MAWRRTLRGDIAQIPNPMIRDGVITGFRTNLYAEKPPEEVVVTVTVPEADAFDGIWHEVRKALEPLPVDVLIRLDLP